MSKIKKVMARYEMVKAQQMKVESVIYENSFQPIDPSAYMTTTMRKKIKKNNFKPILYFYIKKNKLFISGAFKMSK